jgi:hypothetical protein
LRHANPLDGNNLARIPIAPSANGAIHPATQQLRYFVFWINLPQHAPFRRLLVEVGDGGVAEKELTGRRAGSWNKTQLEMARSFRGCDAAFHCFMRRNQAGAALRCARKERWLLWQVAVAGCCGWGGAAGGSVEHPLLRSFIKLNFSFILNLMKLNPTTGRKRFITFTPGICTQQDTSPPLCHVHATLHNQMTAAGNK